MKNFLSNARRFLIAEDGPTSIEYALMLALIIIVCLAVIRGIGTYASLKFNQVGHSLSGS